MTNDNIWHIVGYLLMLVGFYTIFRQNRKKEKKEIIFEDSKENIYKFDNAGKTYLKIEGNMATLYNIEYEYQYKWDLDEKSIMDGLEQYNETRKSFRIRKH